MANDPTDELPPASAPEAFNVCVRDWYGDVPAQQLTECAWAFTREISRYIDLSNFDGVTLGGDYAADRWHLFC